MKSNSSQAKEDLIQKVVSYNLWFNVAGKNSYKGNKTLWEIAYKKNPKLNPKFTNSPTSLPG